MSGRKPDVREELKRIVVICLASLLMAGNIRTFVQTGGLYPGGATGLTILIQRAASLFWNITLPYTVINVILNAVPIYIGFRYIGKKFTLYSCLMILLSGALVDILPSYVLTYDTLLISIFGGMINGFVISMCLSVGATSGGTDFISIFLSEKKGMDAWNMILAVNVGILLVAGLMFGWDKALYSIIFQYFSTQVLHLLYKKYQQQTLLIVSDRPEEVCRVITEQSHHGATILHGEGAFDREGRAIVYSVVSRAESKRVIKAVKQTDEKAFINSIQTDELTGRFYRKPED